MSFDEKATVLMPVYNSEEHLAGSIQSILNQTYKDFKFVIIDDGSTDNSAEIILRFDDSRIIYLKNEINLGIVKTLNKGIDYINSEYIIRMDADDIAHAERLEKQIDYMDKNTGCAVAGTSVNVFQNDSTKKKKRLVNTSSEQIRSELFFNTPLLHPTVIIRTSVLKKEKYRYRLKYKHAEDYGLWQEISLKYEIRNLNTILLDYRVHHSSVTQQADKNISERDVTHIEIYNDYLLSLGIKLTKDELMVWRKFNSARLNMKNKEQVERVNQIIHKIKDKIDWSLFDLETFDARVSYRFRTCAVNSGLMIRETYNLYKNTMTSFRFDSVEGFKFIAKYFMQKRR